MLHISVEREGQPRKELRFAKDVIVIGREADHDLQLAFEDGASRQHCRIALERGRHFVEDLGSRNGTKVNGKRIAGRTVVSGLDVIEVGKVKLRVVDQAGAPARQEPKAAKQEPVKAAKQEPVKPAPVKAAKQEPVKPAPVKPEPVKTAKAEPPEEPVPESPVLSDINVKVNLRPEAEPEPEPEPKPSGPVNDENEACRSQIDPLARRWRDLGRPPGLLLFGPLLARGLAWAGSDRKLRPRPSELHREFIYASRGERRARVRRFGVAAGALVVTAVGGSLTARALHDELVLRGGVAGAEGPINLCAADNPTLARADQLAQVAAKAGDLEVKILAGARALAAADGPCARQSEAERVLRDALSRQRSRVIGRGDSPLRALAVGLNDRDVVSVDASGVVTLLDRSGASAPRPLAGGSGPARVAALGPDERWLAVGTEGGAVDLWDLSQRTSPKLTKQLEGYSQAITALGFSDDGRFLASGDARGAIRVWDMRGTDAGTGLGEMREHKGAIERLVFRDGGKRLYGLGGRLAIAWDMQEGRRKGKGVPLTTGGDTTAFAVNGEGDEVVLGDSVGQVIRYKVKSLKGAPAADTLTRHEGAVVDLSFIPKERAVLSLGADKKVIVSELTQMAREDAQPIGKELRGLAAEPLALAADPTGRRIAVAAKDHKIYVWDVTQRDVAAGTVAEFGEHAGALAAIVPTFDGNYLVSVSADGTARLWSLQSEGGGGALTVLSDHRGPVLGLGLSTDGARLLSFGADKTVRAWRLDNRGAPRSVLEKTYPVALAPGAVALSPDGRWAAVGADRQALFYDLGVSAADSKAAPLERSRHGDALTHIAFSASEEWVVTADGAGQVNTWRMRKEGPEENPTAGLMLGGSLDALAVAPNAPFFAAATALEHRVDLYPLNAGGGPGAVVKHDKNVLALVYSGGGDLLVSTSEDYRALLRKIDKGKAEEIPGRKAIAHDQRVRAAALSADKRWLATGSDDGVVVMTDLAQVDAGARLLKGHEGPIVALAFEPGSEVLVSASRDKTARLWLLGDLDRGGEVRSIVLTGHGGPLTALRVDGGGRLFVTAGEDGQIRVWPLRHDLLGLLACRTVSRTFTDDEWGSLYPGEAFEATCEAKP